MAVFQRQASHHVLLGQHQKVSPLGSKGQPNSLSASVTAGNQPSDVVAVLSRRLEYACRLQVMPDQAVRQFESSAGARRPCRALMGSDIISLTTEKCHDLPHLMHCLRSSH